MEYGDIFYINEIDVMPMYFSATDMQEYIEEILAGKHLEKEGRFYPIGRLASIETINVLWEKNSAWTNIVNKVRTYPQDLFDKWYSSEVLRIIDEEDLGRAKLRHEVLFYHQVVVWSFDMEIDTSKTVHQVEFSRGRYFTC